MIPVYIAGPYAADTQEEIDENVRRACVLALFATRMGYAPIVVHPAIAAGAYGDDANPEDRKRGTNVTLMLVEIVAKHPLGRVWAIKRDDGALSPGTATEVERFHDRAPRPKGTAEMPAGRAAYALTWAGWKREIEKTIAYQWTMAP